ncbi:MAG TPA: ester cyclase [Pirellulales bacterium]|nr:ester cyclase [Pirellulales bacterium]
MESLSQSYLTPGAGAEISIQPAPAARPDSINERNKEVARRIWRELVNGECLENLHELVSDDFVDHAPLPGTTNDVNGLLQRLHVLHSAFPDFRSTIAHIVAENDKVVAFVESSGTHRSSFAGLPPTGRHFTIQEAQVLRIKDGKMVEHWQVADLFGMLKQLGLVGSDFPQGAS